MNSNELLELGFVDTSYVEEGINFTEFTLQTDKFCIEVSGETLVEIQLFVAHESFRTWIHVPNCKDIEDIKCLIRLFE